MATAAEQVAASLRRIGLGRESSRRADRLALAAELARGIAEAATVEQALDLAARTVFERVNYTSTVATLVLHEAGEQLFVSDYNADGSSLAGVRRGLMEGVIGDVILHGEPVLLARASEHPELLVAQRRGVGVDGGGAGDGRRPLPCGLVRARVRARHPGRRRPSPDGGGGRAGGGIAARRRAAKPVGAARPASGADRRDREAHRLGRIGGRGPAGGRDCPVRGHRVRGGVGVPLPPPGGRGGADGQPRPRRNGVARDALADRPRHHRPHDPHRPGGAPGPGHRRSRLRLGGRRGLSIAGAGAGDGGRTLRGGAGAGRGCARPLHPGRRGADAHRRGAGGGRHARRAAAFGGGGQRAPAGADSGRGPGGGRGGQPGRRAGDVRADRARGSRVRHRRGQHRVACHRRAAGGRLGHAGRRVECRPPPRAGRGDDRPGLHGAPAGVRMRRRRRLDPRPAAAGHLALTAGDAGADQRRGGGGAERGREGAEQLRGRRRAVHADGRRAGCRRPAGSGAAR